MPSTATLPSSRVVETAAAARPTAAGVYWRAAYHQNTTPSAEVIADVRTSDPAFPTMTTGPHGVKTALEVTESASWITNPSENGAPETPTKRALRTVEETVTIRKPEAFSVFAPMALAKYGATTLFGSMFVRVSPPVPTM